MFKIGFEKTAVSVGWAMRKIQGGLRTRAGLPRDPSKVDRFINRSRSAMSRELGDSPKEIKKLMTLPVRHYKDENVLELVKELRDTRNNPSKALKKLLQSEVFLNKAGA
jgi:hypothetical protein